ncbi:MAG: DUF4880 domain-containing protein, partial [Desulfobacteraceae bacterium]
MEDKSDKLIKDRIQEQAASWFAETRDKNFSQKDQEDLQNWLAENPEHQAAFEEISRTSQLVTGLFPDGSSALEDILSQFTLTEPTQSPENAHKASGQAGRNVLFPGWLLTWKSAVSAAVMVMLFLIGPVSVQKWFQHFETSIESFQTAIGEKRELVLEDGSHIKLNTKSMITVKFSHNQRLVQLYRGEAFFDV